VIRALFRLGYRFDRWHLRWGLSELDQRSPEVSYILQRLAFVEQRLGQLGGCRCV